MEYHRKLDISKQLDIRPANYSQMPWQDVTAGDQDLISQLDIMAHRLLYTVIYAWLDVAVEWHERL